LDIKEITMYGQKPFDTSSIKQGAMNETPDGPAPREALDRKSTRLNSSHGYISYAVFCLKKKK